MNNSCKNNTTSLNNSDLDVFIDLFPKEIQTVIHEHPKKNELIEVVMDLGYHVVLRFSQSFERLTRKNVVSEPILKHIVDKVGAFNSDNRAGMPRTLNRISCIRNRKGGIVGVTCRVGRAVIGSIEMVRDVIESGRNILLLGSPGIGKTTNLRESARVLSDENDRRVVIVDTSNEIGGDGDIPHPGIGTARRMQVASPEKQHLVMIEAVQNHTPEIIIVDEIGTAEEASAARTIAERGVQLIATAHGYTLENVIKNPTLSDLVGGVQSVVLGDEEAKFRGTQKTVLERRSLPTFEVLIEIRERDVYAVYQNIANSVDHFLRGDFIDPDIRERRPREGQPPTIQNKFIENERHALANESHTTATTQKEDLRIFPFGINTPYVSSAIDSLNIAASIAPVIADADIILTEASQMKGKSKLSHVTKGTNIPIHVLKQNDHAHITDFLRRYFHLSASDEDLEVEAIREVRKACIRATEEGRVIEVSPRHAFLRRVQRHIAKEYDLNAVSVGDEPNRRVRIYPRVNP